jgi:PAS domain S-box-containing protein
MTALLGLLLALSWQSGRMRAAREDAEMRDRLLRRVVEIANTLNPNLVRRLTFTSDDKGTPAFETLGAQMTRFGRTFPQRGIYSMALRENNLYFGPENYAPTDPMASPPGTDYKRPPLACRQIFKDKRACIVGPFTDEYGTFISALAPVLDPRHGRVLMVVGVDILADDWQARLNNARRKPFRCTLSLLAILSVCGLVIRRRNRKLDVTSMNVGMWIIRPMALALIGGLMILWGHQYWQYKEDSARSMDQFCEQFKGHWHRIMAGKIQILKVQADQITANPALLKAWQNQDRADITVLAMPLFEHLKREYGINHFSFTSPDGTVFVRSHQPGRYGDTNLLYTVASARQTGEDSWGVELGSLGAFTLRYVRPWKKDGQPIGYLVLGMEIDDLTEQLAAENRVDYVSLIRKSFTTRAIFERGSQEFGYAGTWETYPDFVVAQQTIPSIPPDMGRWLEAHAKGTTTRLTMNVRAGAKHYACGVVHLPDTMGRDVADLVVMQDVSVSAAVARGDLALSMMLSFLLFGSVLGLLGGVIAAAERQVIASFAKERESGLLNRTLLDTMTEAVLLIAPDGRIIQTNPAAERLLRLTRAEIESRHIYAPEWPAFHVDCKTPMPPEERATFRAMKERRPVLNVEMAVLFPDRPMFWINVNAAPIINASGQTAGVVATLADITQRKQAEETLRLNSEILLNLSEGIYLVRVSDGTIIFTNPQFERMFGYEPGEMIGKHVSILNAPGEQSPEALAKAITEVIVRNGKWSGEVRNIRKDGEVFWSRAIVSAFDHPTHGSIMVAAHEDISEHKRMQDDILRVSTVEKQNLGRDLHDGVAQQIAASAYLCHALDDERLPPAQRGIVKEIESVLQQSVRQLRNVAQALMPAGLEESRLLAALERLTGMLHEMYRVNARLTHDGAPGSVDPQTSTHLYYLVHEAVMNAVRHGHARNILISLFWNLDACERVSVEDDGGGFDPTAVHENGMGLQIMRHRARHIGGVLTIDSRPGRGTRIIYERGKGHA